MNATWHQLRSIVAVLSRGALAAVFLAAAAPKLADPHAFAAAVYRYQLMPDGFVNLFALGHAWIEMVIAIAILFPRWRRAAAALMILILMSGALALTVNLARGMDMACGCFSLDPQAPPATWLTVVRNLGLTVLAGWAVWSGPGARVSHPPGPGGAPAPEGKALLF